MSVERTYAVEYGESDEAELCLIASGPGPRKCRLELFDSIPKVFRACSLVLHLRNPSSNMRHGRRRGPHISTFFTVNGRVFPRGESSSSRVRISQETLKVLA